MLPLAITYMKINILPPPFPCWLLLLCFSAVSTTSGSAQVNADSKHKAGTTETESKSGHENAINKVLAGDRFTQLRPIALAREVFTNDLGMRFVPVPIKGGPGDGKSLLFSVWETRVKDFSAFVDATNYDAKTKSDGKQMSENWQSPGFEQNGDHPVVFVNWNDARAFCKWLTDAERKSGHIKPNQHYRLPTDH